MVAVTGLAVVLFALPLAVAVSRFYRTTEVARLQRDADLATGALPASGLHGVDPIELPPSRRHVSVALYDNRGHLVAGSGPLDGGRVVRVALHGKASDRRDGGDLATAVPLRDEELIVGAARASRPWQDVSANVHRTWLAMAALAAVAVGIAAAVASAEARRLAAPVLALAAATDRLGQGDFGVHPERSGIAELDEAAAALDATASRLGDLVQRERTFSADASHQLSTPLTSLQYTLERPLLDPTADRDAALHAGLAQVDRLQATVQALLTVNRDGPGDASADVAALIHELRDDWSRRLGASGRPFDVTFPPDLPRGAANPGVVRQVLDVLLENAEQHGAGTVTLRARPAGDGMVVEVEDEGLGVEPAQGDVFERRSPRAKGHGIGLSLARSLAAAEGGRLILQRRGPHPLFVLALPAVRLATEAQSTDAAT
jgi:signal transduction histidine kinase